MRWSNKLLVALISVLFSLNGLSVFATPLLKEEETTGKTRNRDEYTTQRVESIPDPFKSYNRAIYRFNDKAYFYFLKPVARGFKAVLPEKMRVSLRNSLSNAGMPVRFLNCVLQLKLSASALELTRFTVNTTWGIGGVFDPAKSCLHIRAHDEDFGQTLGFYGVREGIFIIWPFLGPSSLRDTIGALADCFSNPLFYVSRLATGVMGAVDKVNETSLTLGTYEELKRSSVDPYLAIRNGYFQHRRHLIKE